MDLFIKDRIINGDLEIILEKLKEDSKKFNMFREIRDVGDNLLVTCAYHSNGQEQHPSATIMKTKKDPKIPFGYYHCFACDHSVSLPQLVADFFNADLETGEEWLYNNFGGENYENNLLAPIELEQKKKETNTLDESILTQFEFYHPYMWKRNLSKEVVDLFSVGYDNLRNAITFPVWDERGRLKFITARSVTTKRFWIPKDVDKHILYLLNFAIKYNVPILGITEAQIDALTSWGYGIPCCATLGGISEEQINILNKSGIRIFITMFDNDEYGRKFTKKFNYHIRKDVLVYEMKIPNGKKDINDLSKEEFNKLLQEMNVSWRINLKENMEVPK